MIKLKATAPLFPLIASFDVGVKNLAFCVLRHDPDLPSGQQYPIEEWTCLDLTDGDDVKSRICEGHKANGEACTKSAKIVTDEGSVYCGVHNPDKSRYTETKSKKVVGLSYETIGNALMDRLEAYKDLWARCDHVIIEQQFTKNRRMIFLSAILFSYFLQIGQRNEESKISRVKFASSRNKLLVYDGPEITERTRKDDKAHRKWLAVRHCEYVIRGNVEKLSFLNKFPKKKDDLSDCFLQGADYLKHDCRATGRKKEAAAASAARKKIKVTLKSAAVNKAAAIKAGKAPATKKRVVKKKTEVILEKDNSDEA